MDFRLLKWTLRKSGLLKYAYILVQKFDNVFSLGNITNSPLLINAMRNAPKFIGDYYEFGVYEGHSIFLSYCFAQVLGFHDMRFFGFDSFEGLPAPIGIDRHPNLANAPLQQGCLSADANRVLAYLAKRDVDMRRITLIKGFYDQSLKPELYDTYNMRPARIVMIDCDLYHSTVEVLKFILPLLREGTVLVFDDWGLFDQDGGEQRAYREMLENNPDLKLEPLFSHRYGNSFRVLNVPEKLQGSLQTNRNTHP